MSLVWSLLSLLAIAVLASAAHAHAEWLAVVGVLNGVAWVQTMRGARCARDQRPSTSALALCVASSALAFVALAVGDRLLINVTIVAAAVVHALAATTLYSAAPRSDGYTPVATSD